MPEPKLTQFALTLANFEVVGRVRDLLSNSEIVLALPELSHARELLWLCTDTSRPMDSPYPVAVPPYTSRGCSLLLHWGPVSVAFQALLREHPPQQDGRRLQLYVQGVKCWEESVSWHHGTWLKQVVEVISYYWTQLERDGPKLICQRITRPEQAMPIQSLSDEGPHASPCMYCTRTLTGHGGPSPAFEHHLLPAQSENHRSSLQFQVVYRVSGLIETGYVRKRRSSPFRRLLRYAKGGFAEHRHVYWSPGTDCVIHTSRDVHTN